MNRSAGTFRLPQAFLLFAIAAMNVAAAARKVPPEYPDMPPYKTAIFAKMGLGTNNGIISSDGKWAVAADEIDGKGVCVSIFDLSSGQIVRQLPFSKDNLVSVRTVRLSADNVWGQTKMTTSFFYIWDKNFWGSPTPVRLKGARPE